MRTLIFILLFLNPVWLWAQKEVPDSVKRPNMSQLSLSGVKWAKSEGNQFWFYYQPSMYFFKDTEFNTITLENGEILVYLYEANLYLLLPDYPQAKKQKEENVELASDRSCIFIRSARGRFWIYDHGLYVSNIERMGTNQAHQVICRSRSSDKRYFINESDFYYGPVSKAIGILAE